MDLCSLIRGLYPDKMRLTWLQVTDYFFLQKACRMWSRLRYLIKKKNVERDQEKVLSCVKVVTWLESCCWNVVYIVCISRFSKYLT